MDKCPIASLVCMGQICLDIILEKYTCATVDVHQQVMKVDILGTDDLVSSLCVCVCVCVRACVCVCVCVN